MKKNITFLIYLMLLSFLFGAGAAAPEGAYPEQTARDTGFSGVVISKAYGNGGKGDGVTRYSFIELYNCSGKTLELSELAVYCRNETGSAFSTYELQGVSMKPDSYYLIRCEAGKEYDESSQLISLDSFDAQWDLTISNKAFGIALAPAGLSLNSEAHLCELEGIYSYLEAGEESFFDAGYVDDISKGKYVVRTALKKGSGYEVVNLSKANSTRLVQLVPRYSQGRAGLVRNCSLNEVCFNYPAGIYPDTIELELSARDGYTVYYTVDGSDPTASSSVREYTGALTLTDSDHLGYGTTTEQVASVMWEIYYPQQTDLPGAYVIKAYASNGAEVTAVYTATYFISSRLPGYDLTVMSISLDKDKLAGESGFYNNFYSHSNESNPRSLAVLEVFDAEGTRQGYSQVELAVSGHGSSGFGMKSMKVYYKKANNGFGGLENKLYYDLFDGNCTNCKGQTMTCFSRLVLRNSGNDARYTLLRDAFEQQASSELEVDTSACAPVLVFLNGEFWGVYNARERYSQEYVEEHYGVDKDNVVLLENDYTKVLTEPEAPLILNDGEEGDEEAFNALVRFITSNDMSSPSNMDYVKSRMDVEGLVDLYIAHLFFNATDWPENNIKVWRNKAGAEDSSGMDDRWHFALHDLDFGLGYYENNDYDDDKFCKWLTEEDSFFGSMMPALLKNNDFRMEFAERFYTVLRTVYTPERLGEVLSAMSAKRSPVMSLQVGRWSYGTGISLTGYRNGLSDLRTFLELRGTYVLHYLCSYFSITEEELMKRCGFTDAGPLEPAYHFRAAAFDSIYMNGIRLNVPDGNAESWLDRNLTERVLVNDSTPAGTISLRGWIGFDEAIEAFGYRIGDAEPVFGDFSVYTEAAVKLAVYGGSKAQRFEITVPVEGLEGDSTIVAVVKVNGHTIELNGSCVTDTLRLPDTTVVYRSSSSYRARISRDMLILEGKQVGSIGDNPETTSIDLTGNTGKELVLFGCYSNNVGIEAFGYRVDNGEAVYSSAYTAETDVAVSEAGRAYAGSSGATSRFRVSVPVEEGCHTIQLLCNIGPEEKLLWTVNYNA